MNTEKFKLSTYSYLSLASSWSFYVTDIFPTIGQMVKTCIYDLYVIYILYICVYLHLHCFVNFCLHKENV